MSDLVGKEVCWLRRDAHPVPVQVSISGEWSPWQAKVPQIEVETHKVAAPDVVVPTLDTVRHEALLYTWLAEHKPLVLCGPPGSGKTMTLFSALRALPDMEVLHQEAGTGVVGAWVWARPHDLICLPFQRSWALTSPAPPLQSSC